MKRRPARRRRGPAPIIIIAVAIVALISCWVIGRGCGGNKEAKMSEELRTYALEVNKLIDRSATIGTQFESLRKKIAKTDQDELKSKLDELAEATSEIAEQSSKSKVAELAENLQPLVQVCFDLRANGLAEYKNGLVKVFEGGKVDEAADQLSAALMDLVVSDESLAKFSRALEKTLKDHKVSMQEIAKSTYVPEPSDALLSQVQEMIDGIGGGSTTSPTSGARGLAVVGLSTTPARVDTTSSGLQVLPQADSIVVKATIENQGNQTEDEVEVEAKLDYEDKDSPQTVTRKITKIKPNEKKVLIFEDLKPNQDPDVMNVITVYVSPVEGEKNEDNNVMKVKFVMQSEE